VGRQNAGYRPVSRHNSNAPGMGACPIRVSVPDCEVLTFRSRWISSHRLNAPHDDPRKAVSRQNVVLPQNEWLGEKLASDCSDQILVMIVSLRHLLGWMVSAFSSREDLVLENLALRQQLLALHATRPRRRLTALHKLFWVALRTFWSGWTKPLVLVTPDME